MSLDGSYDMILLPPPCDSDNGGRQPARRRWNRRRLPRVVEEQHSSSPRPLPRRRRGRRGNQGQAGGSASSAVERVDGASAPTGGASGIDLAFETRTSAVSPQRADSEQTDDANTLVKGLLDVTLVPETTVWSVPDVTSSLPVDQEVPTDSHLTPPGFSLDPPSDFALAGALIEASPNPLGFRMRSPWDRLTDVSTYGPSGSEEDDVPDFCWDFSGLGNPSAMRDFMTACDYCLSDCSDGSRSLGDEDCGPSRECFHVDLGGPSEGNHLGMPEDGDLPRPVPHADIPRELAVVPVQAGAMTRSSSKSAGCRPGSTREQERLSRPLGRRAGMGGPTSGRRNASSTPGLPAPHRRRCQGQAATRIQWGRPEPGCSSNASPCDARAINHRGAANPGRAQESPGRRRGPTGRELRLPKAGAPLGTSCHDFPIHAGSLGLHRAHVQHSACGPGTPRQRAPSPRPSGSPR
jgi:hypothetical protein